MSTPLFLIPIVTGLIAQALKPLLNKKFYATINPQGRKVPRYGGMPSAHTAFAFSLVTVVAYMDGINSSTFALAAALLILILDDALRMRMFLGRYGKALYQLVKKLPQTQQAEFPYVEQRLGHKPVEVFAGGVLGICLSWAILMLLNF